VAIGSPGLEENVVLNVEKQSAWEGRAGEILSQSEVETEAVFNMDVDENVQEASGGGVVVVPTNSNSNTAGKQVGDGSKGGGAKGVLHLSSKRLIFKRRPRSDSTKTSGVPTVGLNKKSQGPDLDEESTAVGKKLKGGEGVGERCLLEENFDEMAGLPEQSRQEK